jgi:hypothetical protein
MISGQRAYRRHLPHFQQDNRSYYITFVTHHRWVLPPLARDLVMQHVLFDDQRKMHLHAAVVMPDHGHILMTPFWDEHGDPYGLAGIMKGINGSSARTVNEHSAAPAPCGSTSRSITNYGRMNRFSKRANTSP